MKGAAPAIGDGAFGISALALTEGAGGGHVLAGSRGIFAVAYPVRRDIAGVTHRQAVIIRSAAEFFNDLERGGLLSLQAIRVDGVHDRHRRLARHLFDKLHAGVEISLDLDHDRTMNHGLRQFAERDLAVRNQHEAGDAGARGIGRRRRRGVAGGRADDGAAALFHRLGHGHGHAAILEGTRRIQTFELDVDVHLLAQLVRDVPELDQRRRALTQTDDAGVLRDRQAVAVFFDEAGVAIADIHNSYLYDFGTQINADG
jgi:hypothetical protein